MCAYTVSGRLDWPQATTASSTTQLATHWPRLALRRHAWRLSCRASGADPRHRRRQPPTEPRHTGYRNPMYTSQRQAAPELQTGVGFLDFNFELLVVLVLPFCCLAVPSLLSGPLVHALPLALVLALLPGAREVLLPALGQAAYLVGAALHALTTALHHRRPCAYSRSAYTQWMADDEWDRSEPIDVEPLVLPPAADSRPSTSSAQPAWRPAGQAWAAQPGVGAWSTHQADTWVRPSASLRSPGAAPPQPDLPRATQASWERRASSSLRRSGAADASASVQHPVAAEHVAPVNFGPPARTLRSRRAGMHRETRVVRRSGDGRVGVDLVPHTRPRLAVRILLVVFPFLRSWGGFL